LARPEEDLEEVEEIAEHKALRGLEGARKYIHQSDMNNTTVVMCNKVENELYR
jgi:hypothetical protein